MKNSALKWWLKNTLFVRIMQIPCHHGLIPSVHPLSSMGTGDAWKNPIHYGTATFNYNGGATAVPGFSEFIRPLYLEFHFGGWSTFFSKHFKPLSVSLASPGGQCQQLSYPNVSLPGAKTTKISDGRFDQNAIFTTVVAFIGFLDTFSYWYVGVPGAPPFVVEMLRTWHGVSGVTMFWPA